MFAKVMPIVCILCILGMTAAGLTAFAQSSSSSSGHRAVLGSGKIYLMYDLETGALCYVTSMGGIDCTHANNYAITNRVRKIIKDETTNYQRRESNPPHMILIDFPLKVEVKIKPQKEEEKTYLKQAPLPKKEQGKENEKL